MGKYGTKKCKECGEEFEKRAPIHTYCSIKCEIIARNKRKSAKSYPKPIAKFSSGRAKRNAAYLQANRLFLAKEENTYCIVMAKLKNKTVYATEVHHIFGREGERLNDQEYWLPVSREGHKFIHMNPEIAYEQGWLTKDYYEQLKSNPEEYE